MPRVQPGHPQLNSKESHGIRKNHEKSHLHAFETTRGTNAEEPHRVIASQCLILQIFLICSNYFKCLRLSCWVFNILFRAPLVSQATTGNLVKQWTNEVSLGRRVFQRAEWQNSSRLLREQVLDRTCNGTQCQTNLRVSNSCTKMHL